MNLRPKNKRTGATSMDRNQIIRNEARRGFND